MTPIPSHRARADQRAIDLSNDLAALAKIIAEARDHISFELAISDGAASAQSMTDGSRSTGTNTAVEAVVMARAELRSDMRAINDDVIAIANRISDCAKKCRSAIGRRVPTLPPERCYSDPGLAGYLVPLSEGGWFDPLCTNTPRSAGGGQCDRCRKRLERWRESADEKPLDDERPIEHDTRVSDGESGTVHAWPAEAA